MEQNTYIAENGYVQYTKRELLANESWELELALDVAPVSEFWWVVIDPQTENKREEIFYHRKDGESIFFYDVNRTWAKGHDNWTMIVLDNTAGIYNFQEKTNDNIYFSYKTSATDLEILWGKIKNNSWAAFVVPNINTSTLPLVNNTINYIYVGTTDSAVTYEFLTTDVYSTDIFIVKEITKDAVGNITLVNDGMQTYSWISTTWNDWEDWVKWDTGDQGIQGIQWIQWDTWIQWIKGDTGDQGIQWPQWIQWVTWDTWIQWIKGDTGDTWGIWITGDQGIQWIKGDTGDQGIQGIQWDQGIQWETWASGSWSWDMLSTNNLSDVASTTTARSNLGVESTTQLNARDTANRNTDNHTIGTINDVTTIDEVRAIAHNSINGKKLFVTTVDVGDVTYSVWPWELQFVDHSTWVITTKTFAWASNITPSLFTPTTFVVVKQADAIAHATLDLAISYQSTYTREDISAGTIGIAKFGTPWGWVIDDLQKSWNFFDQDVSNAEFLEAIAPVINVGISNVISANTGMTIAKSAWVLLSRGWNPSITNPDRVTTWLLTAPTMLGFHQNWSGWITVTGGLTVFNPDVWDDWTWAIATVGTSKWTTKRVYLTVSNLILIEHWQEEFNSSDDAIAGLFSNSYNRLVSRDSILLWGIAMKKWDTLILNENIRLADELGKLGTGWATSSAVTTWGAITGALSAQADLQSALDAKANINWQVFTWNISASNLSWTNTWDQDLSWYEPGFSKNTAFNKNFGTSAGTALEWDTNVWLVGTKEVDEAALADGKMLQFDNASWKYIAVDAPSGGGWGLELETTYTQNFTIAWGTAYNGPFNYSNISYKPTLHTFPTDIFINPDGTRLFVIGWSTDKISQYNMSTPNDVSTASFVASISISSQENQPYGLTASSDGTKFYITWFAQDRIWQYNLSAAWDITTAVVGSNLTIGSQEWNAEWLDISSDGNHIYLTWNAQDKIFQYDLATPYDISTAAYSSKFLSISAQEGNPMGVRITPDGLKMFIIWTSYDAVKSYNLSVAFDVSTAVYDDYVIWGLTSQDWNVEWFTYMNGWEILVMIGSSTDSIYQYGIVSTITDNVEPITIRDFSPYGWQIQLSGCSNPLNNGKILNVYQYSWSYMIRGTGLLYDETSEFSITMLPVEWDIVKKVNWRLMFWKDDDFKWNKVVNDNEVAWNWLSLYHNNGLTWLHWIKLFMRSTQLAYWIRVANEGLSQDYYSADSSSYFGRGSSYSTSIETNRWVWYSWYLYGGQAWDKTYWRLLDFRISASQSKKDTMAKFNTGTSAQAHTWIKIEAHGASTWQRGIVIDMGTTGTWKTIEVQWTNASSWTAPTGTTTKYINISIDGVDYTIEAKSAA